MKVFKFGGASVKNAQAVVNVKNIVKKYKNDRLIIVVSAMGKTTNALEKVVKALYEKDWTTFTEVIEERRRFHAQITSELFPAKHHPIHKDIQLVFDELLLLQNQNIADNYDFQYDQIVSKGEFVSTKIIAAYLAGQGMNVCWRNAHDFIRTNNKYRAADVDWKVTKERIQKTWKQHDCNISVTQGFVGHTDEGFATTLGREGSDFTAAIMAFCSDAESVTIWKDVSGMLNADPKYFQNTVKLDKISYKEAIELAYYGASVIHPKTIKPLQNKNIPLYIKSFLNPSAEGSVIQQNTDCDELVPSFIFKLNQLLVSITPRDFSFVVEENLSDIFNKLAKVGVHINLMQNSAVSFTVCIDADQRKLSNLMALLQKDYIVKYNENVELLTIRHFDQQTIERTTKGKEILMEQKTRQTVRIVMVNQ